MKDKELRCKDEKKVDLNEYYGLEPEMSLQSASFATTDNDYLNEYSSKQE